ncbi:clostripain-related cysteine peptidase [Pseudolysinimonas yzui]|uniref:Peptidase C11 n=1 Tax=Pseudolysinimonas yzui TaxID=2708254 RepID=A0A8J3GNQ0_9MICO|nr:clostripain-related cysteine peptidase [Pseudolysinimonas yzui]GHF08071.1 hypothetical protein GCM10011600_06080 [Pseudolysinimonas yzui]
MARSRLTQTRLSRVLSTLGAGVLAAAGLTACVGTPGGIQAPDSWTVLTYEIADTNLEPFMMDDVEEMGVVGSQPGFNLISLVDRAEGYTDTSVLGIPDWTGAKLLEIEKGGATELADYGPLNTGDPDVLAAFISESIKAYPAANYALIISDHGASWPGVGGDESHDYDSLTLAELDQAIGAGLEEAGVDKLALLGFDACLMATYEVASTMAPHADRLVASQELEPGHGWDYTSLEAAYRGATPDELGSAIIDGFGNQALASGTENEITLSLIDLENFAAVDTAVAEFAAALTERVADVAPSVGRTLAQTLGFGTNPDPRYDTHMKDLGILAGEISVDALDVADEADAVVRAVNDVVLDKVDGQATRGATGLSIYFPPNGEFYNADYAAVAESTGWADFLTTYYAEGGQIDSGDLPDFISNDAIVQFADGGLYVSGQFGAGAEANISEAFLYYGILNGDGTISYIGERPAQVSTDGSGVASAFYNLGYLSLDDGSATSLAYLAFSQDENAGTASVSVPLEYYEPGSGTPINALLELGLDASTGSILSETYYSYNPDTSTYGELAVQPGGVIVPLVQNYDPATGQSAWASPNGVELSAELANLQYFVDPLPSGTQLVVELWVVDFGGNNDYVSALVTVP